MKVAAVTYDSPAVLKQFSDRVSLAYPLLADEGSKVIRAFGILNTNIPEDNQFFGVPFPGTYIVDAQGTVKSKYFEDDYRERFTAGSILVKDFGLLGEEGRELTTKHLKLRTWASNTKAYVGSRVTVGLDVELLPGMHVYAPGVQDSYKPIDWKIQESPAWVTLAGSYPKGRLLRLRAINETVPVYQGKFRLTREVVVGQPKEIAAALTPDRELKVQAWFYYQACDDKICYAPVTVPLDYRLYIAEQDRTRARKSQPPTTSSK
ncbi:MAG: redoxin domain-containing protein [Bryobacterales bacterium]|nr:redoxin domain-containing protein [Bryobacterales bacterium]